MAGLKTEQQIREALSRKLSQFYAEVMLGTCDDWPYVMALGHPSRQWLLDNLPALNSLIRTLRNWEGAYGTSTIYQMREAGGPKRVPSHIVVPSADVAARLASPRKGERWETILPRTQSRTDLLRAEFPQLDAQSAARVLRSLDACDDLECDLVLRAGAWMRTHQTSGLTYRQVPIPGIDSKWLQNRKRCELLETLSGKEELGLVGWPALVEFSYLDPIHLAAGKRHYDSWTLGDVACPAYEPSVVIVVENKDTYLSFPQVDGGICVFGSGFAGAATVGRLPWLSDARHIVYWGDLDADGFEILNSYRASGLTCSSILMDVATLKRFGCYGTNLEKDHRTRIVREKKDLPYLTASERAAYDLLIDPNYTGNRRLEQERIPLDEAIHAIACLES
ncbi:MAG: hypothetical protein IKF78_04075 [Atopobiaceae bacterium]|nr:hypothetical protein [Atopobiaceae bacterium]